MSYLILAWPAGEPVWIAELLRALPPDWRVALKEPGRSVAVGGAHPPAVHAEPNGVAVGDLLASANAALFGRPETAGTARHLCRSAWGDYVAVQTGAAPDRWAAFRSPSGGLDALVWRLGDAFLVAGDLPGWLGPWLPRDLSIDWSQVAAILADPARASGEVAFTAVQAIAPGALWTPGRRPEAIWTPAIAARAEPTSAADARQRLREVVDKVVQAQAGGRTLIELSGGLDSAIVASALRGWDVLAVNYFSRELGGDERSYARAVAARLGLELLEVEKPAPAFDLRALAELAGGARPGLNALDFEHDQDMAARCEDLGVEALLTGQGGDHVFFQAPSPLIAADALGAGLGPKALAVIARRTGRSAWSVLREAVGARVGGSAAKVRPNHVSARAWEMAVGQPAHPWLDGVEGLPPAKALQIACLAAAQGLNGASRRGTAARLRHPLLSQPVMELCLPMAVFDLTQGGHDRALARQAFCDRLPVSVIQRQGKGRLTSHYGRVVASGLPALRPLLLEGRLADKGLLDEQVLDQMLSPEHLAWRGGYGVIMTSAALELWVRSWEARLGTRPGLL